ncbi:uncharacterized protein LOC130655408 [Hydractinia symbiolongicarpus]|uniref:uncharacterized protein LOC130655408 n=1 Tax=Hydractinia symbiolongicarpus TaxID=13093 RepID=UPI00254DC023|nr:uncharacterized protein LOC130655408 [Hydractinia symbiolongicarpus]
MYKLISFVVLINTMVCWGRSLQIVQVAREKAFEKVQGIPLKCQKELFLKKLKGSSGEALNINEIKRCKRFYPQCNGKYTTIRSTYGFDPKTKTVSIVWGVAMSEKSQGCWGYILNIKNTKGSKSKYLNLDTEASPYFIST